MMSMSMMSMCARGLVTRAMPTSCPHITHDKRTLHIHKRILCTHPCG